MDDLQDYKSYYDCLERLELSRRLFPVGPTTLDLVYVADIYEEFMDWTQNNYGTEDLDVVVAEITWSRLFEFLAKGV